MFKKLAVIATGLTLLGFGLTATPVSAQRAPSISITKTVTTEPGVCGTSSSIEVEAGTTVYYCYSITNTGDFMLDEHNLVDDKLGVILDDFEFELEPDASVDTVTAGLTVDAVITETTTNVADWDACRIFDNEVPTATPQGIPCASDTATAVVTVVAAPTTTTTTEAPPAVAATGTPRFTG
jgi:hypothetical protein